jgi:hypothetical protein
MGFPPKANIARATSPKTSVICGHFWVFGEKTLEKPRVLEVLVSFGKRTKVKHGGFSSETDYTPTAGPTQAED